MMLLSTCLSTPLSFMRQSICAQPNRVFVHMFVNNISVHSSLTFSAFNMLVLCPQRAVRGTRPRRPETVYNII